MTIIKTRNSSTASAVPTAGNLVQGELAVNVADKRLFTEDNAAQIIEIGTNPTSITTGAITASGTVTANGQFVNGNALLTGGSINNMIIGNSTAAAVTGTVVTASTGFVGGLTGNVTGNLTGNTTGNVTGNVTGDLTGNVTAASGTTSLHNLSLTGTVDFNTARLTDIGTPLNATDAVTKLYADNLITNLIDGAPAALDTLNELAAAMADDATFHTTVTNSIATKLPLAGGALSGNLAMGTNKITGLADPTSAQDAATRSFVLAQAGAGLPTSGGTMTGDIAMSTNKITGLGDPTSAQDASSKNYVDSILGSSTAAATSAAAALVSQNAAATSAATATTQAGISTTKAGESSTSATSAASSLTSFNAKYLGASATVPSGTAAGQLYFNTTSNTMFVYSGSSWAAAGSAVNGTAERQEYTATSGQTSFNATYDVGFVDVYLNGSKLIPTTDFTATNGSQVVLISGAALGDNVSIIAYGAFNVADVYTQSQSNARYMQLANNLSDVASAPTALTNLGLTATAAELNYTDGVTSNIQTQLNAKGTVSNLADLSITSTSTEINKLDAVSRGSLIYGNASAETAILTKGTANQVLTSDGTDISWADAAAGGTSGWAFISTTTVSSGTARAVDIQWNSLISTYKHFVILFEAHNPWSNGAYLQGYTLYGSNHDPLTANWAYNSRRSEGGSTTKVDTNHYMDMTPNVFNNNNNRAYVGQVMVINSNSTLVKEKRIVAMYGAQETTNTGQAHYRCEASHTTNTAQITGFRFYCSGGSNGYDCCHGKFHLYGVI